MSATASASTTESASSGADAPLVELCGVSKRFGDGPLVLRDLALTVRRGEFVALIGPSGCGKSTILRLLSGLSPVSEGAVRVAGVSPKDARDRMAYVFQDATLLPWLDVTRNIEVPLRLRGVAAAERRQTAVRLRGLVGLDHVPHHYPRQLSGGMKMRVSLARALSLQPEILLLDEPFGALDEMTRDRLNEELLALRGRQEFTAFFVTHSVSEAVFLSSRVIVLASHPGRVHRDIAVPIRYPRTFETRDDPAYQRLTREVSHAVREVALPAQGGGA